jgi:hypothetical protein
MLKIPLLIPASKSILRFAVPLLPYGFQGCPFNKKPKVFFPSCVAAGKPLLSGLLFLHCAKQKIQYRTDSAIGSFNRFMV